MLAPVQMLCELGDSIWTRPKTRHEAVNILAGICFYCRPPCSTVTLPKVWMVGDKSYTSPHHNNVGARLTKQLAMDILSAGLLARCASLLADGNKFDDADAIKVIEYLESCLNSLHVRSSGICVLLPFAICYWHPGQPAVDALLLKLSMPAVNLHVSRSPYLP